MIKITKITLKSKTYFFYPAIVYPNLPKKNHDSFNAKFLNKQNFK